MKRNSFWPVLIYIFLGISFLFLVYFLRAVFIPIFFAFTVAYMLDPAVSIIEKRVKNRTISVCVVLVCILVLCILLLSFLIPCIFRELVTTLPRIPEYIEAVQDRIPPSFLDFTVRLSEEIHGLVPKVAGIIPGFLAKVFESLLSIFKFFAAIFLGVLFLFYFLKNYSLLITKLRQLIEVRSQRVIEIFSEIDRDLSTLLRAQVSVVLVLCFLYGIGLLVLRVQLAIVIGIIAGVLSFIPYLGVIVGVSLALLMSLLDYQGLWQIFGILGLFSLVQIVEGLFLTPRIIGKNIGLSGIWVILALFIGGELLGIIGLILALPCTVVVRVLLRRVWELKAG